jgi:hypothetical protein
MQISGHQALRRFLAFLGVKRIEEGRASHLQLLLQPRSAIAIATGPRLAPILVAAFAPVVRILHFREIEVFFPVRPFFLQRRGTVADFHPADGLVGAEPRVVHVAQIFAFSDRALAQLLIFNGLEQIAFATGFNAGSNQIAHWERKENDVRA